MKTGFAGSLKATSALLLSASLLTGAALTALAQAAQTFNVTLNGAPFSIGGAPATVRAGQPIVFNARNTGPEGSTTVANTHNLAIEGSGVNLLPSTPNLIGGQSGTITFAALQPGTYRLYCPVAAHRSLGMEVTFTVVAAAGALPATGGPAGAAVPVLPLALAAAGVAAGAAGLILRRRSARYTFRKPRSSR